MDKLIDWIKAYKIILIFAVAKLVIHLITATNYGFQPDPSYPEVFSFNDAFMEWIPRQPYLTHLIYIGYSDRLPQYFRELETVGTVDNPHFREKGMPIYFGSYPTQKLYDDWEETWQESKGRFIREGSN